MKKQQRPSTAVGVLGIKTNNGVLILAAIDDKQIRIEVGYGLEGAVPDITANQIIRNDIGPAFRSGDYYDGLDKAAESIIKAARGEYKAPDGYGKRKGRGGGIGNIIGFIVIIIIIAIFAGRGRGGGGGGGGYMSRRGYGDVLTPFIIGSLLGGGRGGGGGGGGWSGGGGGGFGGFGGGSSGGGGASGSW
nr:TPM domain-containing protein [Paraflavitalea speifideiaquila]